ncbi:hypothetical protein T492DRAFT_884012 [Pavlovales sp. CCMP2436]|nr:hypothetical protein T492DRAFT_884012 [Pavlovales sp. CCMP2436]
MASPYESYQPADDGPSGSPHYEASPHYIASPQHELERPMVEKSVDGGSTPVAHYRDVPFAVLFVAQLFAVLVAAVANGRHVALEMPSASIVSAATLRLCAAACLTSALFAAGW